MTFYNHIESVRNMAIDLTNGRKWRGASDKAAVFDALDAARREYMHLSDDNAKLLELAKRMARALGVGSNLCDRNCGWEFECDMVSCPIEKAMRELGIEVD